MPTPAREPRRRRRPSAPHPERRLDVVDPSTSSNPASARTRAHVIGLRETERTRRPRRAAVGRSRAPGKAAPRISVSHSLRASACQGDEARAGCPGAIAPATLAKRSHRVRRRTSRPKATDDDVERSQEETGAPWASPCTNDTFSPSPSSAATACERGRAWATKRSMPSRSTVVRRNEAASRRGSPAAATEIEHLPRRRRSRRTSCKRCA